MRFTFVGQVVEWRGPAPYVYVRIPDDVSAEIRELAAAVTYGWGVLPVEARIGAVSFTTSLFPKDGRYLLPLRAAVRKQLGVEVGDDVQTDLRLVPAGS